MKAAVRQKMGVGVALAESIQSEVASGEFKILKVTGLEPVGQSYIVYSTECPRPLSPIAQEFLEMLRIRTRSVRVKKPFKKFEPFNRYQDPRTGITLG